MSSLRSATVQFVIAMIASALTDRLTRKMEYMHEEQRILIERLQQATGKKSLAFTADSVPISFVNTSLSTTPNAIFRVSVASV